MNWLVGICIPLFGVGFFVSTGNVVVLFLLFSFYSIIRFSKEVGFSSQTKRFFFINSLTVQVSSAAALRIQG